MGIDVPKSTPFSQYSGKITTITSNWVCPNGEISPPPAEDGDEGNNPETDTIISGINTDYSVAGNAGGEAAGTTGGWYMAAEPRSTDLKIKQSDGTDKIVQLGTLSSGTDYYVFVDSDGNVSVDTSETKANNTRIGGFHTMCCSTTGLPTDHPYYNYAAGQIMPTTVWTNKHHPADLGNGAYAYLANYTGNDSGSTASDKAWAMIYPGTQFNASGAALSNMAASGSVKSVNPLLAGYTTTNVSYNGLKTVMNSGQRFPRDNGLWTSCGNYGTLSSCPNTSEFCAISDGNPNAGSSVSSYAFLSSGGFVRNNMSMISKMGAWATIGYKSMFLDKSSSVNACNGSATLYAGCDIRYDASLYANQLYRGGYSGQLATKYDVLHARFISPDVAD
jgi:hypothetical protein